MDVRKKFKNFGGSFIPDIVEYLKSYIKENPNTTISLGCDSVQKRRRTIYAVTIMLYNKDVRNGAHVVFFRENINKVRDNFQRLHKEAEYVHEIAQFLEDELQGFYTRSDISEEERKKYKYHLLKCDGQYSNIQNWNEENIIKNINLSEHEKNFKYKLVDLHLDFNPFEGKSDGKGYTKNKSHLSYKIYVPWLRSLGWRVFAKNVAFAASSAADLLLQD